MWTWWSDPDNHDCSSLWSWLFAKDNQSNPDNHHFGHMNMIIIIVICQGNIFLMRNIILTILIIIISILLLKMIMHDCHFNFMIMMKNGHIIIIIINYNPDDHDDYCNIDDFDNHVVLLWLWWIKWSIYLNNLKALKLLSEFKFIIIQSSLHFTKS